MKHRIDPMIDCVAKAILGDAEHTERTVDFLQAVLQCDPPIAEVTIENPFSVQEFLGDTYVVVDVRVRDTAGNHFVVEIQIQTPVFLPQRMVYGWADAYKHQLHAGEGYHALKPVVTIWLLGRNLFRDSPHWHHTFRLIDPACGLVLSNHVAIHTLELLKWHKPINCPLDAIGRWMYFFSEAADWEELPPDLEDPMMRQAMQVLKRFADKEEDYRLYQARENYARMRLAEEFLHAEALASLERERAERVRAEQRAEQERAAKEQERAAKEQERAAREKAQEVAEEERESRQRAEAELAFLREQLKRLGIDPKA